MIDIIEKEDMPYPNMPVSFPIYYNYNKGILVIPAYYKLIFIPDFRYYNNRNITPPEKSIKYVNITETVNIQKVIRTIFTNYYIEITEEDENIINFSCDMKLSINIYNDNIDDLYILYYAAYKERGY